MDSGKGQVVLEVLARMPVHTDADVLYQAAGAVPGPCLGTVEDGEEVACGVSGLGQAVGVEEQGVSRAEGDSVEAEGVGSVR
jgi:hypothetical protein